MEQIHPEPKEPRDSETPPAAGNKLAESDLLGEEGEKTQEEYRKAYIAQLRALQCPGCGESELF